MDILIELLNDALNETGHVFASIPEGVWQFLAFAAAAAAAVGAFMSARVTRLTAQAQLFSQLRFQYSSDEMRESLEIIGSFREARQTEEATFFEGLKQYLTGEHIEVKINRRTETGLSGKQLINKEHKEVNQARRRISHFFQNAFELFSNNNALNKRSFYSIYGLDGFEILFSVVEWLEFANNRQYKREKFTDILEHSGRPQDEIDSLNRLRPPRSWNEVEKLMKKK
jgi:hypothetical protein